MTGVSSKDPRTSNHPLLAGGIICQMRVGADGSINSEHSPGATERSVLVMLHYEDSGKLAISYAVFIPLDLPRIPVKILMRPKKGSVEVISPQVPRITLDDLRQARSHSPFFEKQSCDVAGKPGWWIMNPVWEEGSGELLPTLVVGELYRGDPDTGANPVETMEIARRLPGEPWRPLVDYLKEGEPARRTRVTVDVTSGMPVRVRVSDVADVSVEDLLIYKEVATPKAMRRNDLLLRAKNRTLLNLLREGRTSELSDLAAKVDQTLRNLEVEAQALNARAQSLVEAQAYYGHFGAGALRELTGEYRERIEILKPIGAAIRAEIANRSK